MYNGRKALGQRIKEERIKMFLTQEQLAEKVGISRLYITFIEKGNRSVRVEVSERIADCLNVSMNYLVKGYGLSLHMQAAHDFEQLIKEFSTEKEIPEDMDIVKALLIR